MSALHLVARARDSATVPPGRRLASVLHLFGETKGLPELAAHQALNLILDLSEAVLRLLRGTALRLTLQFDAQREPWEIGLERCGFDLLLSLFRPRPAPVVLVHDRRVPSNAIAAGLRQMVSIHLGGTDAQSLSPRTSRSLRAAYDELAPFETEALEGPRAERVSVQALGKVAAGLGLSAAAVVRAGGQRDAGPGAVERSDLHALLGPGRLSVHSGSDTLSLECAELFLDTEELLSLGQEALRAFHNGEHRTLQRRLTRAQVVIARTAGQELAELSLRLRDPVAARLSIARSRISETAFARSVAHFAGALAQSYCDADGAQRSNLRLTEMRHNAERLLEQSNSEEETLTNPQPDSYRQSARRRRSMVTGLWERGGRINFRTRWVATVPGLDLRATFLCGDRVIVDSSRETACLDRQSGRILWRSPSGPAACTVSPAGLVRLRADGLLSVVDLESGKRRFELQLKPRSGGGAAGSLIHAQGLPRVLTLTDGDRQISAIDVLAGTVRWRHTTARPGNYRLRRVGRLLLAVGGNTTMVALDVATGETIWRQRSRTTYTGAVSVDQKTVVAVCGGPQGYSLQAVDPWSGVLLWTAELGGPPVPGRHPLLTPDVIVVPIADDDSAGAQAFDRATGRPLWRQETAVASLDSAWLALDDCVVVNDAQGILLSLNASTGRLLYSQVFPGGIEGEAPRRLEPVLRNGALFVPQQQVQVVRPRTGEVIGVVPPELVPDLLRVDERCDVYLGEESGHLAAFSAEPRLSLVSG